jgi:hypothetical protein
MQDEKWLAAWKSRNEGWVDMVALISIGVIIWGLTAVFAIVIGRVIING